MIATRILWPELFELWEDVGRRVTYTRDGRLHHFVALVHEVGDLPSPAGTTLQEAVLDWRGRRG